MTVGKNKRLTRGRGGKGVKKKVMDPFIRKEWYDVKAPATFEVRKIGKTPVNKSAGTKKSSDALKGRVFEVSLGDLSTANSENVFRKFKLISEEVSLQLRIYYFRKNGNNFVFCQINIEVYFRKIWRPNYTCIFQEYAVRIHFDFSCAKTVETTKLTY